MAGRLLPLYLENIFLKQYAYLNRGCVTPKQIENLIETSGGDTEMVDGYDELPEEYQEKVKFALKNGHVPDEDWKGVSTLNEEAAEGLYDQTLTIPGC
jgi:hypothetical protein